MEGPVLTNADAFIKLSATASSLALAARYQPATAKDLKAGDTDLGSGGPMLLPTGMLIGGGKDGAFYVLPRSDLQTGATSFQAFYNTFHAGPTPYPHNAPKAWPSQCPGGASVFGVAYKDQPCFVDQSMYVKGESFGPNIHGGPVYWQRNASTGLIYKMAEKDYLKAFRYDVASGTVDPKPAFVATLRPAHDGMPGGFSSVSANGTSDGIVWTVVQQIDAMTSNQDALLYAFDAASLEELWNNGADKVSFAKFNSPTIADGRVILPGLGLFQVYGLKFSRVQTLLPFDALTAILHRWRNTGGADGALGKRAGQYMRDGESGGHSDFARVVAGGGFGAYSVPAGTKILRPMCDESKRPNQRLTAIKSSMYASPQTGAHFVRGEIRRLFLAKGGLKTFGYPLSDEVPAPDGLGLETRFEHATIRWNAGKGARVVSASEEGGADPRRRRAARSRRSRGLVRGPRSVSRCRRRRRPRRTVRLGR
jgi:hypothetical protein